VLKRHNVRKIIASCPHCFNTFANEYGDFGGDYEVIHHTQLIDRLLKEGRITLDPAKAQEETITYHDSCYLGRWNDIFAPPREILERIPGLKVVEMARSKSEGMCCGAGGGRMWMEEDQPRVNHRRVDQAVDTKATQGRDRMSVLPRHVRRGNLSQADRRHPCGRRRRRVRRACAQGPGGRLTAACLSGQAPIVRWGEAPAGCAAFESAPRNLRI